jgi:hypothetical protein
MTKNLLSTLKMMFPEKINALMGIAMSFIAMATNLAAQPVLQGANMQTGLGFNLYTLSNVTSANLSPGGANITWNLSAGTATLLGTADLQDMASTPYALQYPAANFAMKFTVGGNAVYSLFNLTGSILEEVANNVGTSTPTTFLNYRTALVFPYTFNLTNTDTYQKNGQSANTISHTYDAYGTITTSTASINNLVRDLSTDNGTGTTSALWWNASPVYPVLQADNTGVTLWQLASNNGIEQNENALNFRVYPNPSTNELRIINQKPITKIEICTVTGQVQLSTTQSLVDITTLQSGVYFVKAYMTNGVETVKFVKQ